MVREVMLLVSNPSKSLYTFTDYKSIRILESSSNSIQWKIHFLLVTRTQDFFYLQKSKERTQVCNCCLGSIILIVIKMRGSVRSDHTRCDQV